MQISEIVSAIDDEISRLQDARKVLAGGGEVSTGRKPRKNAAKAAAAAPAASNGRKRRLSPEGRKRIAEAMKRRWAERRKQQAK